MKMLSNTSYNFVKSSCEVINAFINELKQKGILAFSFSRVYKDGKTIFLCSDEQWVTVKFDKVFFNAFLPVESTNNRGKYIHTGVPKENKVLKFLFDSNRWNTLQLHEIHSNYVDIAHYSSTTANSSIINLYINNIELFEVHFELFKERFHDLIHQSLNEKYYLELGNLNSKLFHSQSFLDNKKNYCELKPSDDCLSIVKLLPLKLKGSKIILTSREFDCLHLLSMGQTSKEIGKSLGLSYRTIETYVNQIKLKTGMKHKSLLAQVFHENYKRYLKLNT